MATATPNEIATLGVDEEGRLPLPWLAAPLAQVRALRHSHALLLHGPAGVGHLEFAGLLAQAWLCEDPARAPCGRCGGCRLVRSRSHPDLLLVLPEAWRARLGWLAEESGGAKAEAKPSRDIKVEQVRQAIDWSHQTSGRGRGKAMLLHPADALNGPSANALLKTLEEPAPDTLFLLVSHEPERLLPTIRSRCQAVPVPLPAAAEARAWLAAAGVDNAERWLALAGGAPLLAAELGGSGESRLIEALLEQLARGPALDPLAAAAALDKTVKAEKGGGAAPMKRLMEWAQKWLVDLSLAAARLPVRYFVGERERIEKLAARSDAQRLLAFSRKALQYRRHSEHPLNSRLFLEDFFLGYAALFERSR